MRFVSPGALWWLLAGAIIILFYLLKLKRNRRVVPSVLLWQRALEEIEANAPFKKLRRNLLLLLQLIALAAIVFALARPLVTMRSLASGNTIIIIDSTASMSAKDEADGSRLDRAKQLAREMVSGLARGDRAAIIESSSRVRVLSPLTEDHAALVSAIGDIQETDAAGNLTDAVLLAEQIAKAERDAHIVIISDGGGSPLAVDSTSQRGSDQSTAQESQPRNSSLRFVRVGRSANNIGIVALNSRPARSGNPEMFASLANFSATDRAASVELRIDGQLVDARAVTVAANAQSGIVFDALPQAGGLAELRLAADDDLASDNTAYTHLPDARRLRVGVASENPFLLQAVAVNTDIDARRISSGVNAANFDCIIVEGATGAEFIAGNRPVLAINPPDAAGLWRATSEISQPQITSVNRAHPVNAYLSFGDVHIESVTGRATEGFLAPVIASGNDGLVWAGDDARRRVVMIGFDLAKSDLPLKVEFPIMLANSIAWLSGRSGDDSERVVRAGQPALIRASAPSVTITTPSGETEEATSRDGVISFADTLRAGMYQVSGGPSFAVSLASEAESNITPKDSIKTRAGEVTGQTEEFSSEREIWRWVALAALGLLMIEWLVYHRRITV